ncbi:low molecular weight phosphotyrosine protein phosphatase [Vibrio sp. SS-MA-C1-2]|uniref:low molecular weight protein-tyrosine-phosphatase n=1 Tax=Vibrio sp. SS-MA-C1-2 TaxID=2908646 RepID=UPI001F323510|nr:low molecular weight protein-tyrosine-phosphatase [Vibrio sp. SS-MA-C1-2]UJF17125.1 low molecular weight phosphotyrosine protein phosphatase [Vibrio sp. SS-MA-C1-2]
MFNSILVVCVGNICRSPAAEVMFKELLPHKEISSAGVLVEQSGLTKAPPHRNIKKVLSKNGIDVSEHKARQLTESMCDDYELILTMDNNLIELISEISPTARGKTMLLGQWIGQSKIIDPIKRDEDFFAQTYNTLDKATTTWARKLAFF